MAPYALFVKLHGPHCDLLKLEVERLVERFAHNLDVYKRADYKEAHVRVEFIDPFFEALGWDVHNVQGHAEQYKDVVHENAIKVSGATRAPGDGRRGPRPHRRGQDARNPFSLLRSRQQMKRGTYA